MATNWGRTEKPKYAGKGTKRMAGDALMGRAGNRMHRDSAEHMDKKDAGAQKQLDKYSKITEGGGELSERQQKKKEKYEKGIERRDTRREAQEGYKQGKIGTYDFASRGSEGIDRRDIQGLIDEGYSVADIQKRVGKAQSKGVETGKKAQALLDSYTRNKGEKPPEETAPTPAPAPTPTPDPTKPAQPAPTPAPAPAPTPAPAPAPAPTPAPTNVDIDQTIDQTKKFSGDNRNRVGGDNYGNMGNQDFSVNIQGAGSGAGGGLSNMQGAAAYGGLSEQVSQKSKALMDPHSAAMKTINMADSATGASDRVLALDQRLEQDAADWAARSRVNEAGWLGDLANWKVPEWAGIGDGFKKPETTYDK